MGLGGPVWHASAAPLGATLYMPVALRRVCMRALRGVGDAGLGEWWQDTGRAMHLRRRLSAREAAGVGPVLDVRRTDEARIRVEAVWTYIEQAGLEDIAWEELP